jgi:toxin ParE1/3/4
LPDIVVSPRAAADLDDIWEYTTERWGERQAAIYLRLIKAAIGVVAADPKAGRVCDEVRLGYRRYPVGSHMLFYRVTKVTIVVVRILHQRMDVERHL